MASDESIGKLKAFPKARDFFVGIDSDGCAFDTMETKHKECFIPNTINSYGLQAVSRLARQTAEWVNLYSRWRGINRFPALVMTFDLLAERPDCVERGYKAPDVDALRKWIKEETQLGNPALEAKVKATGEPDLVQALAWSKAVNEAVAKFVRGIPPFPHVRESIENIRRQADVMVVSATPGEALLREWREHGIDHLADMICGQELGSKTEHIQFAAAGRYPKDNMLMVGDAPGDLKAARANHACFYPIIPGDEAQSWKRLHEEAADRFFAGDYRGEYEEKLIEEFLAHLPSNPPWNTIPHDDTN
jgi:phosphoglycolate phosphatase-like HAD superfamily hydrolase